MLARAVDQLRRQHDPEGRRVEAGKPVTVNDTKSYNNGIKVVPSYLLAPVLVTQANVCTAYDPTTSPSASAAALATDYCKSHK